MASQKDQRGQTGQNRINIHEEHEIKYWADNLKCSKRKLLEVISLVGPSLDQVKRELVGR